jgi:hypothetical protein
MTRGRWLLIALAFWALAMILPDFYRVFGPLGSFGLIVDNDGRVVDVVGVFDSAADSPAAQAGIVVGDRIDLQAMRCVPLDSHHCRSLLSVIGGLGGSQAVLPERQVELHILSAGGSARTVRMTAAPVPDNWAQSLVLLADTLVGIVVVCAAFRLVWIRPGAMTWGFFLYAIWFNPGQTFTYYALLQPWPAAVFAQEVAEGLAQGAAYGGLLLFALRFPGGAPTPPWSRLEWLPPVVAVAIAALCISGYANAFGFRTETLAATALLAGYAVDAAVLFVLLRRRRTLPVQDQQRMLWVIWGCAIGLSTFILAEIAQSTALLERLFGFSPSEVVIGLLYLLNGVLVYFVSVAVLHRRVISVAIPLRYGTILTALTLAVGIPIVNLHEFLSHYQETLHVPEWVWLLIVAPVALVLLQRLHEIGVEMVDHVLNRRFHLVRRQLGSAGTEILQARSFEEIDRLLVNAPIETLKLVSGAVFRQKDEAFRLGYSVGLGNSPPQELDRRRDAALLRAAESAAPVPLPPEAWSRPGLESELQAPCLAAPVRSEALDAGALALYGPHVNGNDIDHDEREMIKELAARAATGYERVAFLLLQQEVARLREKLAERRGRD